MSTPTIEDLVTTTCELRYGDNDYSKAVASKALSKLSTNILENGVNASVVNEISRVIYEAHNSMQPTEAK